MEDYGQAMCYCTHCGGEIYEGEEYYEGEIGKKYVKLHGECIGEYLADHLTEEQLADALGLDRKTAEVDAPDEDLWRGER